MNSKIKILFGLWDKSYLHLGIMSLHLFFLKSQGQISENVSKKKDIDCR
jgi:hypothetical protein